MFSRQFQLLRHEAFLARSALLSGLTAVAHSNLNDNDRGNHYVALFQLSIGIERLLKIVLVLDHMLQNDLHSMPSSELKRKFSHSIVKLYGECKRIAISRVIDRCTYASSGKLSYSVLEVIGDFAVKTRYHNLDELAGSAIGNDPLADWWNAVILPVIGNIPSKKREKIASEILWACDQFGGNGFTWEVDFNGNIMTRFDLGYYNRLLTLVTPQVNWLVIEALLPVYETLSTLVMLVNEKYIETKGPNTSGIPDLTEFFSFILIDKKMVVKKKKWA